MSSQWETIAKRARQKVVDDIPAEWKIPQDQLPGDDVTDVTGIPATCGILDQQELAITESLATDIVAKIAQGEWKAEDVTRAFCKRAAIAHQLVCCENATILFVS